MLQLVYVSTAAKAFSDAKLQSILIEARDLNWAWDVTGVLLHHDGRFIQALEGPAEAVHDTFSRIQRDSRHHGIVTLYVDEIDQRDFPDWRMGYVAIDPDSARQVDGFMDLAAQQHAEDSSRAHELLREFSLALT
ncbi:BLUF domain-containing protein [Euzebya tangerina]|uniref:BLUF domain-containing protein n=1 Tax=Euzebya tangerina TaxID=591198 RepID=UPI000E30B98B|nr:BLUF domain-containing protein [Euzebya tangerina]